MNILGDAVRFLGQRPVRGRYIVLVQSPCLAASMSLCEPCSVDSRVYCTTIVGHLCGLVTVRLCDLNSLSLTAQGLLARLLAGKGLVVTSLCQFVLPQEVSKASELSHLNIRIFNFQYPQRGFSRVFGTDSPTFLTLWYCVSPVNPRLRSLACLVYSTFENT